MPLVNEVSEHPVPRVVLWDWNVMQYLQSRPELGKLCIETSGQPRTVGYV